MFKHIPATNLIKIKKSLSRIQGKEKLHCQKELAIEKYAMDLCDKFISLSVRYRHERITQ